MLIKLAILKKIFLEKENQIFTRPRRFGKSLNMDMISCFCKLNYQNPGDKSYQEKIFLDNGHNLSIASSSCKEFRNNFMGEFPVISISLKDVQGTSYRCAILGLLETISKIYLDFYFIITKIPS